MQKKEYSKGFLVEVARQMAANRLRAYKEVRRTYSVELLIGRAEACLQACEFALKSPNFIKTFTVVMDYLKSISPSDMSRYYGGYMADLLELQAAFNFYQYGNRNAEQKHYVQTSLF